MLASVSVSFATPRQRAHLSNPSTVKTATPPLAATEKATEPSKSDPAFKSQLESVTRSVEVKHQSDNGWKPASKLTPLATSDKVRTGRRSVARIKLGDGSKVLLLQNSSAEMENLSSVEKTIRLLKGRVRAIVAKINGGNNFKIKTPVGVASVRGTDFTVEVPEAGDSMSVSVDEGHVAVSKLEALGGEVILNAGESIKFGLDGEIGNPTKSGGLPLDSNGVRQEVVDSRVKDSVVAMAAEESRNADYQTGKSLIDGFGERVRVEQYIMRPRSDQFKLVVLNDRAKHFDYFTYLGTFNQNLPEDLSVALRDIGGKLGADAPDYYLTQYETRMSNTIDNITDAAAGGHLVKVVISPDDATKYRIYDNADANHYRDIDIAALQGDGSYKVYNPLRDNFSLVSAANAVEAAKVAVLDSLTGSYRNFVSGDTYWKTRYNSYDSYINNSQKLAYAKKNFVANTLAIDLDASFSNAPITTATEFPDGTNNLHNKLSVYYGDGSRTTYDNYIIDDEGNTVPASTLSGTSNSAAYRNALDLYNYETRVTSTEMHGRYIDLVVDPRIGTKSGLIQ